MKRLVAFFVFLLALFTLAYIAVGVGVQYVMRDYTPPVRPSYEATAGVQ